jgi:hypothetical protein
MRRRSRRCAGEREDLTGKACSPTVKANTGNVSVPSNFGNSLVHRSSASRSALGDTPNGISLDEATGNTTDAFQRGLRHQPLDQQLLHDDEIRVKPTSAARHPPPNPRTVDSTSSFDEAERAAKIMSAADHELKEEEKKAIRESVTDPKRH